MAERGLARARELSFPYEPFTVGVRQQPARGHAADRGRPRGRSGVHRGDDRHRAAPRVRVLADDGHAASWPRPRPGGGRRGTRGTAAQRRDLAPRHRRGGLQRVGAERPRAGAGAAAGGTTRSLRSTRRSPSPPRRAATGSRRRRCGSAASCASRPGTGAVWPTLRPRSRRRASRRPGRSNCGCARARARDGRRAGGARGGAARRPRHRPERRLRRAPRGPRARRALSPIGPDGARAPCEEKGRHPRRRDGRARRRVVTERRRAPRRD